MSLHGLSQTLWGNCTCQAPISHPPGADPRSSGVGDTPLTPPLLTVPGRKALFLNLRRKKARKKVPAMRTRDSNAVLGSGTLGSTTAFTL